MWKIEFCFGLMNGWWFLLFFLIFNIILMKCFPLHYRIRILKLPDFSNGKLLGIAYAACLNGAFVYSAFVSVKWHTIWFLIGLILFSLSACFFTNSLFHYANTDPSRPVTTGIYKYTRNPQQIFAALMWIGVGIATTSFIIILLCVLQLILAYPTFKAQEEYCLKQYGDEYRKYMKTVSRYFGRRD